MNRKWEVFSVHMSSISQTALLHWSKIRGWIIVLVTAFTKGSKTIGINESLLLAFVM